MSLRRRPRISESLELLHGVVTIAEDEELVCTLGGAHVSVEVGGKVEASSHTRVDGSYTITFGSLEGQQRMEPVTLRLTKTDSCREVNATRVLLMQLDPSDREGAIWRQDVMLQPEDMKSVCEVTAKGAMLPPVFNGERHRWFEDDRINRSIATSCLVIGAIWGLIVIWAVARWASGLSSPATRRTYVKNIDFAKIRAPRLQDHGHLEESGRGLHSGVVYVQKRRLDRQRLSEDTASRRRLRHRHRRRLYVIDDDED